MSAKTWKRKFYPVSASKPRTALAAVRHSLRKWLGLRGVVLRQHKLDMPPISMDSKTCALCKRFLDYPSCSKCPLAQVRGGTPCDKRRTDENFSPYLAGVYLGDPEPMLRWLRKAERWVMRKEKVS